MSVMSRRNVLRSIAAIIGVGAAAAIATPLGLFRRRWPATPYDDLLERLALREDAATLGHAVLIATPGFSAPEAAARLRAGLRRTGSLSALAAADAAAKEVREVAGWVLPQSVAELSALAAASAAINPRKELPK